MKQLYYIIRREIMVKVKSRSFYFFALITPLLFVLPIAFSVFTATSGRNLQVASRQVGMYCQDFSYDTIEYRNLKFIALDKEAMKKVKEGNFDYTDYIGVVDMQRTSFSQLHDALQVQLYVPKDNVDDANLYISDIESYINSEFVFRYGQCHGLDEEDLLKLTNFAKLSVVYSSTDNYLEKNSKSKVIAFGLGMLLYIMFILFNNNIVKSISEEKTNKLAEVLSMFVKPSKLMIGKIMGLAMASLLQLMIWLFAFILYVSLVLMIAKYLHYVDSADDFHGFDVGILLFNCPFLGCLAVFFLLGILLNGALSTIFAICSSKKGSSVPMVLSNMINLMGMYFCMYAATQPESRVTVFASYFPFTSYLVIPALLPYGVSAGHAFLSALLLIVMSCIFLFMTGKLYRRFLV